MRILSGACPPGITTASKSPDLRRAGRDVRLHDGLAALARYSAPPTVRRGVTVDAGRAQRLERTRQLAIFEFIFDEHRDPFAGERRLRAHARILPHPSMRSGCLSAIEGHEICDLKSASRVS